MEQYVKKPAAVQVFALNGATDIILRKDIASEKITDEEGNKQTVWNCDERQIRVAFAVTEEEVTADFDSWWDYQPPREAEPVTASDRLAALEAATQIRMGRTTLEQVPAVWREKTAALL